MSRDPLEAETREPYDYSGDNPLNRADPSGLLFGIELPEVCVWPFCGPPPPVVQGAEELGEVAIALGKGVVEGAEITWHGIEGVFSASGNCPGQRSGDELKRESDQILGRGHNPARIKQWQEWWEKVTAKERKEFDKAGGKRPRKRN